MSAPNTNPLSYNAYIQQMGVLAVATTTPGAVWQFLDGPAQATVPQMLNYAELRIQRDLDLLNLTTSNQYTLTAGVNVFPLDIDDFFVVQTIEWLVLSGSTVVDSTPLEPVSREFIQNIYGGVASAGSPRYFSMYGDTFNGNFNTNNNILFGPTPNFPYPIRITGTVRMPSLAMYATAGPADTSYTYISTYYPDMLLMASMIYISAFQRNFSATSDDPTMGATYEKQYLTLKVQGVQDEAQRRFEGPAWSPYVTPPSATPPR